jgi:thiamine biosynthesis lipoprotein
MLGALMGVAVCAALIWGWDDEPKTSFYKNQGKVFGTYYSIQYEASCDLEDSIQAAFAAFDKSLSMFNPQSTLSAINNNRDTVTDAFFEAMWAEAQRVYEQSGGAFDITVAPLVNLWGFGFKNRENVTDAKVDSLLPLIGFDKVQLVDHKVVKADPRMMLDCGAVAKGQACDVIAELLEKQGCSNYLVEIGGEIVARGKNAKGEPWHIGITKPNDNNEGSQNELQEVLAVSDICMATSGNYRNYYYDGNEKRSHTIDPRSGRPVQHALLSATVVSSSCMRADGLATACMVLGEQEALRMISKSENDACYLIVAKNDSLVVMTSPNWEKMLK